MQLHIFWRLAVMMTLQYFIWGAWLPYIAIYLTELNFTDNEGANLVSMFYWASLIAPFIGGQLVDRYFSTEKYLAVVHIISGVMLLAMAQFTDYWMMLICFFAHSMLYVTTLPLTNSISFKNLTNVERDFGYIRVFGTIGWILAGWVLTIWLGYDDSSVNCLWLAGIVGIALGVFCFFLPHTPPNPKTDDPWAFMKAVSLFKKPSFLIFMIISFVVSTELMFYYYLTGLFLGDIGFSNSSIPTIMSIGQIAEIVTMILILQLVLPRVGIKNAIMIGIVAWPIRYIIFAIGEPQWLVVSSLTLHGFCYVFFFVVGQMYVDKVAPKDIRGSAQSLLFIVTFGIGQLVGTYFAGWIKSIYTTGVGTDAVTDWSWVFTIPVILTILCAIAFFAFFNEPKEDNETEAAA